MNQISDRLLQENLITPEHKKKIDEWYLHKPFSIFWEMRTILYLGITLLTTGLGFLIYLNIDTIGHQSILFLIAITTISCFWYCFKHGKKYSHAQIESTSPLFDYILLLGALLLAIFEGYLQYQYKIFGERYGLATFIPSITYLFLAYRFDHRGVLQLGISGIGAWLGLSITPISMFDSYAFPEERLIYSAIILGLLLAAIGFLSEKLSIKKHFSFSYMNFAMHLLYVASLYGMFTYYDGWKIVFTLMLMIVTFITIRYARRTQSFYFLLFASLYGYIGLTYLYVLLLDNMSGDGILFMGLFYFALSCAGIILFFLKVKTFLNKTDAGIPKK